MSFPEKSSRRRFLQGTAGLAAYDFTRGAFAEAVEAAKGTPWVTEGPFYPWKLPLDADNDLIVVSDSLTPAVGQITHLSGKLLDARGEPIKKATTTTARATAAPAAPATARPACRRGGDASGRATLLQPQGVRKQVVPRPLHDDREDPPQPKRCRPPRRRRGPPPGDTNPQRAAAGRIGHRHRQNVRKPPPPVAG